jgi:hypothetical protein
MEVMSDQRPSPLGIVCVGTGRDGTLSLSRMIQAVFDAAGTGRRAEHEYQARAFYETFCEWRETGDALAQGRLQAMVRDCSADCIVGNGYAAVLPLFAQHFGRRLKIVHLRRADRDACIRSLVANCEAQPQAYRYYSSSLDAVSKRMAAFHFGDMTEMEWDRLQLVDKMAWYYDKTHQIVDECRPLFDTWIEITTESLDDPETRRMIARLAGGQDGVLAPQVHANLHWQDWAGITAEQRHRLFWLLGRLDRHRLLHDDLYLLEHALECLMAWVDWCAHNRPAPFDLGTARSPEVLAERLDQIQNVIAAFGTQVAMYQDLLRTSGRLAR